ncbi:hypothetical protein DRQ53_14625, partial [bacterium]
MLDILFAYSQHLFREGGASVLSVDFWTIYIQEINYGKDIAATLAVAAPYRLEAFTLALFHFFSMPNRVRER